MTTFTDEDYRAWLLLRRKEWYRFQREEFQLSFSEYLIGLNVFIEEIKNG